MNAPVSAQIPRVLEGLGAHLAGVRALTRVGALVARDVGGPCEGFAAVGASVGVRPVVDGERPGELRLPGFVPGGVGLRGPLEVLLRVAALHVLQQVRLLQVGKWTLRAGKDLGGHRYCGTCAEHTPSDKHSQERLSFFGTVVPPCALRDFKLLWCCRRAFRSAGLESDCMQSFSMDGAEVSHDTVCLTKIKNRSNTVVVLYILQYGTAVVRVL